MFLTSYELNQLKAQTDSVRVELYAYEKNGQGYTTDASLQLKAKDIKLTARTDAQGKAIFKIPVQPLETVSIDIEKMGFKTQQLILDKQNTLVSEGVWHVQAPMEKAKGYLLDLTVLEVEQKADGSSNTFGLAGATVEVYNHTLQREELRLENHKSPQVSFLLAQGNEYIFLIRKKGYFAKRLRANVNINGCLLCMEGFGTVTPAVKENLSDNNTSGGLITSTELKKILKGESIRLDNIYYDKGKADLRPESEKSLAQLAELLKDNPHIRIELLSHTDSRGSASANQKLSQKRAEAVVAYLTKAGKIPAKRLSAKGFGEEKLLNSCADGVECSEDMHQPNRRTEFAVIDVSDKNDNDQVSLASMMQMLNLEKILAANEQKNVDNTNEPAPLGIVADPNRPRLPPLPLPEKYTGYTLFLFSETEAPGLEEFVYGDFEQIFLEEQGEKIWVLAGDYPNLSKAQAELKNVRTKYPSAKVLQYASGILKQ
jgi:outer membrane protein OmpA-like peptidoglycan-associated protein